MPEAPTALTAGEVLSGSVTLSWEAPSGGTVTGYQVLRRDPLVHAQGEFKVVADGLSGNATRYVDTSVEPEKRYVYRVKARNGEALSRWSNYVNVTVPAEPEPEPEPESESVSPSRSPNRPAGAGAGDCARGPYGAHGWGGLVGVGDVGLGGAFRRYGDGLSGVASRSAGTRSG